MIVGYLLVGSLAGLMVAGVALVVGVSPLLALGLHSLVGTAAVLLIVLIPALRPPAFLAALTSHGRSRRQPGS